MATDEAFHAPCCKPLRLTELFSVSICFTLLFFTRNYKPDGPLLLPTGVLIFLFTSFGTLVALTGADVFSQILKEPMTNLPMILLTLLGTIFCFASGVVLTVSYHHHSSCGFFRILNVIGLLAASSFFSSVIFLIDAIILIRYF